ncbi:MAG: DUF2779 domain-containing protein [Clostridia bacterium]|nr:DUF2779 domain-containing protein [Clostridia bacterium]
MKPLTCNDYLSGIQCHKKLWIETYDIARKVPFETSNVIEESKKTKVVCEEMFKPFARVNPRGEVGLSQTIIETDTFLDDNEVRAVCDPCFEFENCYAKLDVVKKWRNQINIYLIKASTKMEDRFLDELAYQYWVVTKCGYKVHQTFVIILNDEYTRGVKLNRKELFVYLDFTDAVKNKALLVDENVRKIKAALSSDQISPERDLDMCCFEPFKCPYFDYCKSLHGVPERSIFEIPRQMHKTSVKLYKEGISTLEQALDIELDKPYEKQNVSKVVFLRQETSDKRKDYTQISDISDFLSRLTYPLYFLDFETFQNAVPQFKGQKAYQQIPFQYSLHYYKRKGGKLYHSEFLAKEGTDPRRALAEQLCRDIPKDVVTLAYNMSFEKTVIKNLAEIYDDLYEHLMNIHDNIDDLMIPFAKRWYYSYEMHGSYSIKKVLPALFPGDPELDYSNLDLVHKGDEAMLQYNMLTTYDDEQKAKMRQALLKYCELDTYAMVKIYQKLVEVVNEGIKMSDAKQEKLNLKLEKKKAKKESKNKEENS